MHQDVGKVQLPGREGATERAAPAGTHGAAAGDGRSEPETLSQAPPWREGASEGGLRPPKLRFDLACLYDSSRSHVTCHMSHVTCRVSQCHGITRPPLTAQCEITSEREVGNGWTFSIQVLDDDGRLRRHELRLAWADYNLWSGSGADEPARVAVAVMQFLLTRRGADEIPASFDAAMARRWYRDADGHIPQLIWE